MENKFKKIKFLRCIVALAIIVALLASISGSILVSAQIGVPQPQDSACYITIAPTVIGVGQEATVNLWVLPLPATYLLETYYEGYTGITVTFMKPDGTEDTFMPVDGTGQFDPGQTQALGAIFFFYAPDMAGEWSVTMSMPEQVITDDAGTITIKSCTSEPFDFTVTEDPQYAGLLCGYPWAELPDEDSYWSYPISSNNREWCQISGDWLVMMNDASVHGTTLRHWQPYGSAPGTAHILWSHRYNRGGIIGGDYGSLSDMTSSSTDKGALIINGKVFYNIYGANQVQCVDLTTGELLYTIDGSVSCAIHLPGNPFSQSYLDDSVVLGSSFGNNIASYVVNTGGYYGGEWKYYNTLTGTLARTLYNASSARMVDGTNLAYGVAGGNLFAWDLSKVTGNNWPTGITWEVPLPEPIAIGRGVQFFGISADLSTVVVYNHNQFWGYSTEDGASIWDLTLDYAVTANAQIDLFSVNKFIAYDPAHATFHCYSMLTGDELWESDSYADSPWATTWAVYNSEAADYEKLYLALPDGTVSALSLETGEEVWRSTPFISTEFTSNANPFVYGCTLVGGCVYAYGGYALGYSINPIPRFAMLVCINAATGDIEYTLNGGVYPSAAANGYLIGAGVFDGTMYAIGKGPTSTSVIIQDDVVADGDTVLIKGSVLDQSPAAQDYDVRVLFPNGVPAVADEDMSEFMDYLYMQNATLLNNPPTPDGVPVKLEYQLSDGTWEYIGEAVTDGNGNFGFKWVSPSEGTYQIKASFLGSDSYWSSSETTYLTVYPAPASATPIEPEEPVDAEEPLDNEEPAGFAISTEVVIIAVVSVIVGVAALFVLRRRK